jgi:hypothetical protein
MTKKKSHTSTAPKSTPSKTIVRKDSGSASNSERSSQVGNKKAITETRTTGSTGPKEKK